MGSRYSFCIQSIQYVNLCNCNTKKDVKKGTSGEQASSVGSLHMAQLEPFLHQFSIIDYRNNKPTTFYFILSARRYIYIFFLSKFISLAWLWSQVPSTLSKQARIRFNENDHMPKLGSFVWYLGTCRFPGENNFLFSFQPCIM